MNKNILIAYYSQSGNTGKLANMISADVSGTLLVIGADKAEIVDFSGYDTVFVGTPNWATTMSAPVKAFLTANDLSGKTVVPFCTHGMGGLENVATDIAKLCPNSTVLQSFAIKGELVDTAPEKVKAWLSDIGIL